MYFLISCWVWLDPINSRFVGVSNFTIAHLKQAVDAVGAKEIATQQIEIHPFLQNRKVVDFARKQGIHLTAYMPLAYGKVMQDPVIVRIAERHGATPAQIALADPAKPPKDMDLPELAAWTTVSRVMLNLDETLNK